MEAIIYIKGHKYPLKKIICKRENGKYIVENLISGTEDSYSSVKFEEITEAAINRAFTKEDETVEYINERIIDLNDDIINLNKELSKKYRCEDSKKELDKISKLESEIEVNKRTLKDFEVIPSENLDKEDVVFIKNIEKNIQQLSKAIKRLNLRINKKENEVSSNLKGDILKLEDRIKILNSHLRLIKSLKKKENDNPFFK